VAEGIGEKAKQADALVVAGFTPYSSIDARTKAFLERLYPLRHTHGFMRGKPGGAVVTCAVPPGTEGLPPACDMGSNAIMFYMTEEGMNYLGSVSVLGNVPCVTCGNGDKCQMSAVKMTVQSRYPLPICRCRGMRTSPVSRPPSHPVREHKSCYTACSIRFGALPSNRWRTEFTRFRFHLFSRLPGIPEIVGSLLFAVAKQVVHTDIRRISPPHAVGKPKSHPMRPGIRLCVGTAGDTIVAPVVDAAPVGPASLRVDTPFAGAPGIGYIDRFRGHVPGGYRP
jgi:hypothetical protein